MSCDRRKLLARIAELEEAADRERARASKLDKEKNKLAIDIRDITVEYEQVMSCLTLLLLVQSQN